MEVGRVKLPWRAVVILVPLQVNKKPPFREVSDCRETMFSFENVGAINDRPPKNAVFRICRKEIGCFRLAAMDFTYAKSTGDH